MDTKAIKNFAFLLILLTTLNVVNLAQEAITSIREAEHLTPCDQMAFNIGNARRAQI